MSGARITGGPNQLINWFGDFIDPKLQQEFQQFHLNHSLKRHLKYSHVAVSLLAIVSLAFLLQLLTRDAVFQGDNRYPVVLALLCFLLAVTSFCSCWISIRTTTCSYVLNNAIVPIGMYSFSSVIHSWSMSELSVDIKLSIMLSLSFQGALLCGYVLVFAHGAYNDESHVIIALVSSWMLLSLSGMHCVSMPYLPVFFQSMRLTTSFCFIIGMLIYVEEYMTIILVAFMFLLITVWIVDAHLMSIEYFLAVQTINNSSSGINQLPNGKETQLAEMRNMIGNVAHDLKTPLSSFITGLDYIQFVLNDCQRFVNTPSMTIESQYNTDLKRCISSIQTCLNSIRNTNSFMLMTINRCMDYCKATSGFKLVPKYESFSLQETLQLPLECMRNLKSRVSIELMPVEYGDSDHAICPHIVSDKLWLQENLLCLLSNAVKYSSEGTVTIAVRRLLSNSDGERIQELIQHNATSKIHSVPCDSVPLDEATSAKFQSHTTLRVSSRVMPLSLAMDTNSDPQSLNVSRFGLPSLRVTTRSDQSPEKSAGYYLALHEKEKQSIVLAPSLTTDSPDPTPSNSNTPTIHHIPVSQDYLLFDIEDTGIGMTDEAMENLFNPFQQTQRYAGGTGLGLFSLAKRVEALHGYCGVKRRRDNEQGSLFWFMIPYKPDPITANSLLKHHDVQTDAKLMQSVQGLQASEVTAQPLSSQSLFLNILVVDDTPTLLKMTKLMLTKLGHNVVTVESAAIALDKLASSSDSPNQTCFDLILMDMQMPVMDGFETTRRIRAMERLALQSIDTTIDHDHSTMPGMLITPSLSTNTLHAKLSPRRLRQKHYISKIVGMSAYSDEETIRLAEDSGMDLFIEKPFSAQIFNDVIMKKLFTEYVLPY